MNRIQFLACLSAVAVVACAPESESGEDFEHSSDVSAAQDALGIDLVNVGLSAGDKPCGDDAQVASVTDKDGRYLAFCKSNAGFTSIIQVMPDGVEPISIASKCALDTYLAATPETASVPQALVDACKNAQAMSRAVSAKPVTVRSAEKSEVVISAPTSCSSVATFENTHCNAIDTYTSHYQVADYVSWCSSGLSTSAQRTASSQGLPDAFEGRMKVAACGTSWTNIKGLTKKSISGAWVITPGTNINVSPGYVATIETHVYDVEENDDGVTVYGSDLRFQVNSNSGGTFRYTGAFVEFVPTP